MKVSSSIHTRFFIAVGSMLVYALIFLALYPSLDIFAAGFNAIPAATFGWLMGVPGGFFYFLIGLPVNILLFNLIESAYNESVVHIVGISTWTLISIGIGWIRDLRVLNTRIRTQALELEEERKLLQEEIIRRTRAEEKLAHEALHDPLTDLPNRRLFFNRLENAFARNKRNPRTCCAVLFLDLDNFKRVNDTMGHEVGDLLLKQAASRLKASVREMDTVARMGGDEFAVLLEASSTHNDVEPVIKRIQENLARPYEFQKNTIRSAASVGIVKNIATYEKIDDILRDADTAMYQAKGNGGNQYRVFDTD